MTISELIEKLSVIHAQRGDVEVVIPECCCCSPDVESIHGVNYYGANACCDKPVVSIS